VAPIVCFHRDITISTFSHCRVEISDCGPVRPARHRVVPPFAAISEPQSSLRDLRSVLVDFPGTSRPPAADWLRAGLISIVPAGLGSRRWPAGAGGGSSRLDDHGDGVFSCQRPATSGPRKRRRLASRFQIPIRLLNKASRRRTARRLYEGTESEQPPKNLDYALSEGMSKFTRLDWNPLVRMAP
jgi:hypothetical protein